MGRFASLGAASVLALTAAAVSVVAHRPVTSPYTYNDDVFSIFRDRCGGCHRDGGPTPMSLLTYKDAVPWAASIREQLMAGQMPPWDVDPAGPSVQGGHAIGTQEIDRLVTWASGGTPEGDPAKSPPPVAPMPGWRGGPPDVELAMDRPRTVPPGTTDETYDVRLPTTFPETRWVKAADLLPGTPSMVRAATISIEHGPVLSAWAPASDIVAAPGGTAFKLPPGAAVLLRIHYRKNYRDEQHAVSDRSRVGLYFTTAPASKGQIRTLAMDGRPGASADARALVGTFAGAVRVLAVRPTLDRAYDAIDVEGITPAGRRVPLLRLRTARPEWRRRYWLAEPVALPAGTRVEVLIEPSVTGADVPIRPTFPPLQMALDYVSQ